MKKKPLKITAKVVEQALANKHAGDVFITQCKSGPSDYGCKILDAWVTNKSWANPRTIGYEIKVDRGDFLNDNKWRGYLPFCNEFYFVCPSKLIDPSELPPETGLLWLSTTGTRLYTKKKSPYRELVVPEDMYRYILMNRADILNGSRILKNKGREYWQSWWENEKDNEYSGHELAHKFARLLDTRVGEVKNENEKLRKKAEKVDAIARILKDHGLDIEEVGTWGLRSEVDKLMGDIPNDMVSNMHNLSSQLHTVIDAISKIRNP